MVDKKKIVVYDRHTKKTEVPIMLTCGKYTYQLDNKNRLRLPSKVRDDYGDELYLSIDMRGSLLVRSKESMEEIFRKLEQVSMSDWETQDAIMDFSSMTFSVKLDDQRRFMLPAELKNYAKIDKNIVVVGLPRGWSIWAEESYENRNKPDEDFMDFEKRIAPLLKPYGI